MGAAPSGGRGGVSAASWWADFEKLPRERFLPELIWRHDMASGRSTPVYRGADPGGWLAAARADVPIVTQWDDGAHTGVDPGVLPTSSASMPSVVADTLAAAALAPGMRVLEVGSGTGWTAGLLASRFGSAAVTTVEVDPGVADAARRALTAAELRPRVVTGDGLAGVPDGAPYDRLISGMAVRDIPAAWLAQVRPGGLIVTPWGTHYSNADALAVLTVREDGSASGMCHRPVEFMKARSQRLALPSFPPDLSPVRDGEWAVGLPVYEAWHPFTFAAGLRLPGVTHAVRSLPGGGRTLWLYALDGRSWAAARRPAAAGVTGVRQVGARRLWDELTAVHEGWLRDGSPGYRRFGVTVGVDGAPVAWLDSPGRPLRPV